MINFITPDSKVHGANMGPICGRQDSGGPHVDPMNLAIRDPTASYYPSQWWLIVNYTIGTDHFVSNVTKFSPGFNELVSAGVDDVLSWGILVTQNHCLL